MNQTTCTADRHDTVWAYRYGCRCDKAREDTRLYEKRRREGRAPVLMVDCTGVMRRLQALAAIGWSSTELGRRLGISGTAVQQFRRGEHPRVKLRSVARIRRLYAELSMTPGPSVITRSRAVRRGWAPPLAWDDEGIDDPTARPVGFIEPVRYRNAREKLDFASVDRSIAGDTSVPLSVAEKNEVVRRLNGEGFDDQEIARRTGISTRTIQRVRQRLSLPAVGQFRVEVPA